jgi:hypothetical protein
VRRLEVSDLIVRLTRGRNGPRGLAIPASVRGGAARPLYDRFRARGQAIFRKNGKGYPENMQAS